MILKNTKIFSNQIEVCADDFAPATNKEKSNLVTLGENTSYWQDAWRRLKQNKIAMVSLVIIAIVFIFAIVGPLLSPYTYDQQVRGDENLFPCLKHPFGTDNLGRDLLVRTMIGSRISLLIGVGASVLVLVIGSIYGAISGLIGGKVDTVMMRIVEVIYSLPDMLVIILLRIVLNDPLQKAFDSGSFLGGLQILGPGIIAMFIVYGLLYWVGMARIVRGQVLQLKEMEFVNAARALGADNKRLIKKHLLPNCVGQLVVTTMLQIPSAIFTEAFLSFLGIGVSKPLASLGSLASEALNGISSYPYRLLFPAATISIIILAFNLFGDGLRDALDPRLK
ncbi:ABC transporter permease [Anaerobium acetethylicum]|uniref:Oligopeptide transport system permease protein n=1 Tax=Anaerobium acetethylicum TaxID=1619234 RepID=A0A1D3TTH9_9FIRM|nr:ABC transporter permease [Anaerobium acetethylicum]SCP97282.1 oligopeptide transport system permease protein [Anaerobium acetethylicum]